MNARDYDAGFRAGIMFAAEQAETSAEVIAASVSTKRADGAAHALKVLAEELRRELGGEEPQGPNNPSTPQNAVSQEGAVAHG